VERLIFLDKNRITKQKVVPLRDFIYLCFILIIILVSVVTMTLAESSRAGENLNFAATLTSIILAVLAIVITLVDSSGQKENINMLREASNEINSSVENIKSILDTTQNQLDGVITLRDELLEQSKGLFIEFQKEFIKDVKEQLDASKGQLSPDDLNRIIKEIKPKEFKVDLQKYSLNELFGTNLLIEKHIEEVFGGNDIPHSRLIDELVGIGKARGIDRPEAYLYARADAKIKSLVQDNIIFDTTKKGGVKTYSILPF
jgi:hypothetical protein